MEKIDDLTASLNDLETCKLKDLVGYLEKKTNEANCFFESLSKLRLLEDAYIKNKNYKTKRKKVTDKMTHTYMDSIHPVLNAYGLDNNAIFEGSSTDEFGVSTIELSRSINPIKRETELIKTYLNAKMYLIKNELELRANQQLKQILETGENIKVLKNLKNDIECVSEPMIVARSNDVFKSIIKPSSDSYHAALKMYENKLKRYQWLKESQESFFKNIQSLIDFGLRKEEIKQIYFWDELTPDKKINSEFFNGTNEYDCIREAMNNIRKAGNKQTKSILDFENIHHAAEYDLKLSKEIERAYSRYLEAGRNAIDHINKFKQTDDELKSNTSLINGVNQSITYNERLLKKLNTEYTSMAKLLH